MLCISSFPNHPCWWHFISTSLKSAQELKKYFQNGYDFFFCLVQTLFLIQNCYKRISNQFLMQWVKRLAPISYPGRNVKYVRTTCDHLSKVFRFSLLSLQTFISPFQLVQERFLGHSFTKQRVSQIIPPYHRTHVSLELFHWRFESDWLPRGQCTPSLCGLSIIP